jgi:hypothetical protein
MCSILQPTRNPSSKGLVSCSQGFFCCWWSYPHGLAIIYNIYNHSHTDGFGTRTLNRSIRKRMYDMALKGARRKCCLNCVCTLTRTNARTDAQTQATGLDVVLNPGDVLFFPSMWWHGVQNIGETSWIFMDCASTHLGLVRFHTKSVQWSRDYSKRGVEWIEIRECA